MVGGEVSRRRVGGESRRTGKGEGRLLPLRETRGSSEGRAGEKVTGRAMGCASSVSVYLRDVLKNSF